MTETENNLCIVSLLIHSKYIRSTELRFSSSRETSRETSFIEGGA